MQFDFAKLMADPTFQFGLQVLGNSRDPNAIGKAFAAQRQMQELQQQKANQEATLVETRRARTVAEEKEARQLEKDEAARKRQLDIDERNSRFMEQAFGMIGGQPKPPKTIDPTSIPDTPNVQTPSVAMPQTQVMPQAQIPNGAVGRYGTPTSILDDTMQAESGGNPLAVNPDSKAMGAFQFLPSTIAMLKKQGSTFDPFNKEQSRDAADKYIQQLVKQHGTYDKAMAAYGGHKKVDPAPYLAKVLKNYRAQQLAQLEQIAQVAPQGAMAQGAAPLDIARLGAMGALSGMKGGRELQTLAGMMQPKSIPINQFQQNADGTREYIEAPTTSQQSINEQRKIAQKDSEIELERSRTGAAVEKQKNETSTKREGAISGFQEVTDSMDSLSKAAKELLSMKGLPSTTGLSGVAKLYNFTGEGRDASAALDTLQSKIAVDQLMKMKALSSNGASGFGALSGPELRLLETYQVNLSKATSLPARKKALKALIEFAETTKSRVRDRVKNTYGEDATRMPTTGTTGNWGAATSDGWTVKEK